MSYMFSPDQTELGPTRGSQVDLQIQVPAVVEDVPPETRPLRTRVKIPLDPTVLRDHRRLSSWKSPAVLLACYVATAATVWLCGQVTGWGLILFAPIAVLALAAIQGHMSILLHEGAHYLLHPNKKLNSALAELAGMPLLFTERSYRTIHLAHHEHSGDPDRDPERQIYRGQNYTYQPATTWPPVLGMLLRDVLFVNALRFVASVQSYLQSVPSYRMFKTHETLSFIAIHGVPLLAAAAAGLFWEYVLLWYGTLFTLTFFFLKLHIYGEHTGATGPTEFQRTWHHRPNPLFDFFVYPIRSGFHLEHHLYPMVPWHRIKSFHSALMRLPEWREQQNMLDSDGYFFGRNSIWSAMIKAGDVSLQNLPPQTEPQHSRQD